MVILELNQQLIYFINFWIILKNFEAFQNWIQTEKREKCNIFPQKVSDIKLNSCRFTIYIKNYLLDSFKVLLLQYSPTEAP